MPSIVERLDRLEDGQRVTNRHLARIDATFGSVSKLFELMNERLERLEIGQDSLVDGQKLVVDRLDRLIEVTTRERTGSLERLARIEERLDVVERKLEHP
jgi:hypothetical protein